jgi:hypothetical protein
MNLLECGYIGAKKDVIELRADLDAGWRNLGRYWGFDGTNSLDYGDKSKFSCRLRIVAKAPDSWESRRTFPERYLPEPVGFGNGLLRLNGTKLNVEVPLEQAWRPTKDLNRRPSIYEIDDDIFVVNTNEGSISYRIQLWVVLHGPSSMFVRDEYDWGDGFAWIGGRPESDRRRF